MTVFQMFGNGSYAILNPDGSINQTISKYAADNINAASFDFNWVISALVISAIVLYVIFHKRNLL